MWNRCESFPANKIVGEVATRNDGGRRLSEGDPVRDAAIIAAKWVSDVGRVGALLSPNAELFGQSRG